jgi:hypothetical protein
MTVWCGDSHPHVDKRNKLNKKNDAPSWLYVQEQASMFQSKTRHVSEDIKDQFYIYTEVIIVLEIVQSV